MKKLNAATFRIILSVATVALVALIIGVFMIGYGQLKEVGEETSRHKADAAASEDTVTGLQRLQTELTNQSTVIEQLETLRVGGSLPQFSTEQSLRTIARQLDIGVTNITFVSAPEPTSTPAATPAADTEPSSRGDTEAASPGAGAPAAPTTTPFWGGSRNSAISFEFSQDISYEQLIRFLHAVETSTPKLRLDGITIPADSTQNSINPGVLTLEIATS